jgi:hypothetical protein
MQVGGIEEYVKRLRIERDRRLVLRNMDEGYAADHDVKADQERQYETFAGPAVGYLWFCVHQGDFFAANRLAQ